MDLNKYYQVNWTDGMKISKEHFISIDNEKNEQISRAVSARLNSYNYGLLPLKKGNLQSYNIQTGIDNQTQLTVKIHSLDAITPQGTFISIHENDLMNQDYSLPLPEVGLIESSDSMLHYFIAITVNPYKQIPTGIPNTEENPLRYPYTIPDIQLSIIPENEFGQSSNDSSFICIGKLLYAQQQFKVDDNYIPPCTSINSHPVLHELHTKYLNELNNIENHLIVIIKKISEKNQSYNLAQSMKQICESLLHFLSTNILVFKWHLENRTPLEVLVFLSGFARLIKNSFNVLPNENKEELITYICEWCQLKQGDFEELLNNTISFKYAHDDIQKYISQFSLFMETTHDLFNKLSSLDFIGKKKVSGIFVKEEPQSRSSFLAD